MTYIPRLSGQPLSAALEVDRDGLSRLRVWIVARKELPELRLSVDGQPAWSGVPREERDGFHAAGEVELRRGRHVLELTPPLEVLGILLSDDLELVSSGRALLRWENRELDKPFENRDRPITPQELALLKRTGFLFDHPHDTEKCEAPAGVPLGGLGAGKVELTSQGMLTAFTGNNNQDSPIYRMPGSYFALVEHGEPPVARLLQRTPVDQPLEPVQFVEADLAFPEAELGFRDSALSLELTLHAFSPHVPHNASLSDLPCAFFRFTARNPGVQARRFSLVASWESLVNVGGSMQLTNRDAERPLPLVYHTWNHSFVWSGRRENRQERAELLGGTGLRYVARGDCGNPSSFGEHLLWTPLRALVVPDRSLEEDEVAFASWLRTGCRGELLARGRGEYRAGALVVTEGVEAGGSVDVDFLLIWHMPHFPDRRGSDMSVSYASRFSNAAEVLSFAWPRRDELLERTREVRTIVERSTLPSWFSRKLLDERFPAVTSSVYSAEGLFAVNEAPTGMDGCLGTLDQRTCSGAYWTAFFPDLDRVELELFRKSQREDGAPSHDIGFASFETRPTELNWPDLAASYVIQVHRHWLASGDRAFLESHWGGLRRALEWAIGLDDTGDGVPILKAGRGTTYDNQQWNGISAFCSSMHQAALALGAELAEDAGEGAIASRWRSLARKAAESRMRYLWVREGDGGYFRNAYDPATGAADDSCFIGSLAGDWAMAAGGLRPLLREETIRQALRSIVTKNVGERGMTDQSARTNTRAFMQYPAAYVGAMALLAGEPELAWSFLRRQDEIITRAPSGRYHQTLTYTWEGEPRGLPYYMTAPASWLFLAAATGVAADLPHRRLHLAPPRPPGTDRLSLPVFLASSWLLLELRRDGASTRLVLEPLRSLRDFVVEELSFSLGDGIREATVRWGGGEGTGILSADGTRISARLPGVDPGKERIEIMLRG